MNRKFNPVILVGAVLLIAGVAVLAVLASRGGSNNSSSRTIKALVATADIPAGTSANIAPIQVQDVKASDVPAGSPTELGSIAGQIANVRIPKGTVISGSTFGTVAGFTNAGVTLPKGKQAVGVELAFAPGALRYVVPGNKITIWVTQKQKADADGNIAVKPAVPILKDIEVLRTTPGAGNGDGTALTPGPGNLDFLLAMSEVQSSVFIGAASQNVNLYFTVSNTSQG
ncbi:MAG: hypothetical protein JWM40_928 [Frankiales bacterium]|nr:hypothetical protein [Frankiales bacterium]